MDILQWIDTGLRAVMGVFFAVIPGMTVWTVVLTLYLMIRWIIRSRALQSPGTEGHTP
jgi:hypothetical protein